MDKQNNAKASGRNKRSLAKQYEEIVQREIDARVAEEGIRAETERLAAKKRELQRLVEGDEKEPGRRVLLRIEGRQRASFSASDEMILTTVGKYWKRKSKHYLIYDEPAGPEQPSGRTTVIYNENGTASMSRSGENAVRMHFLPGQRQVTAYNTPYGILNLGFFTNRVDFKRNRKGGELLLDYNIDASGKAGTNTELHMIFTYVDSGRKRTDKKNESNEELERV